MKKTITAIFVICFVLLTATTVFAASPDCIITYDLSSEGSHDISVNNGDIITVAYTIVPSARCRTLTTQNEIVYDHEFFELVPDSIKVDAEYGSAFQTAHNIDSADSGNAHIIQFNSTATVTFLQSEPVTIGRFQLKVIGASGSSAIKNTAFFATAAPSGEIIESLYQDLMVTVHGSPEHVHTVVKQEGVPADEFSPGYKEYYKCSCNKFFEDEDCETEITDLNTWKSSGNGSLAPLHEHKNAVKQSNQSAGENKTGNKEYYKCSCGAFFEDKDCTKPIENIVEWKEEHGYKDVESSHGTVNCQPGEPARQDAAGYKDYYVDSAGVFYEDEDCTKIIEDLEAWKAEGGNGYIAPLSEISPQNTETNSVILWVVLGLIILGGITFAVVFVRKKKRNH